MSEIQEKIKAIIADELAVDESEVTANASFFDDLGADSLDVVELIIRLEEEFNLDLIDEDETTLKRVSDVFECIERALSK